ncbi:hypothetical protein NL676_001135 [Syzygium grande]|nr:hypothetical protein NL676_001135 [Syzygium grande]
MAKIIPPNIFSHARGRHQEYLNPIDKQAEAIMMMQLKGKEKTMKEMMKTMQGQALLKQDKKDKLANAMNVADFNWHKQIPTKKEEPKG